MAASSEPAKLRLRRAVVLAPRRERALVMAVIAVGFAAAGGVGGAAMGVWAARGDLAGHARDRAPEPGDDRAVGTGDRPVDDTANQARRAGRRGPLDGVYADLPARFGHHLMLVDGERVVWDGAIEGMVAVDEPTGTVSFLWPDGHRIDATYGVVCNELWLGVFRRASGGGSWRSLLRGRYVPRVIDAPGDDGWNVEVDQVVEHPEPTGAVACGDDSAKVALAAWSVRLGPVGLVPVPARGVELAGYWQGQQLDPYAQMHHLGPAVRSLAIVTTPAPTPLAIPRYGFAGAGAPDTVRYHPDAHGIVRSPYGADCMMNHYDEPGFVLWFPTAADVIAVYHRPGTHASGPGGWYAMHRVRPEDATARRLGAWPVIHTE